MRATGANAARVAKGRKTAQRVLNALIDLREERGPDGDAVTYTCIAGFLGMKRDTVGSVLARLKAAGSVVREGDEYVPQRIEAHPSVTAVARVSKQAAYPMLAEMARERGW